MRAPEAKEFEEWLTHPCTQWARRVFAARREARRQEWEGGSFSELAAEGYAIRNAAQVGECRGLAFAQEMDYESFIQEIEDDYREYQRARAAGQGSTDPGVHPGEEGKRD